MPETDAVVLVAGTGFPNLEAEREVIEPLGVAVLDGNALKEPELTEVCRKAVAVMTDYFRCDAARIGKLERCQVLCQYGVGYDMIDVDAASAAGIYVTCTPNYCVDELADHAMALMLAAARRVVRYDRRIRSGSWDYNDGMPMRRLAGRTLGLLGFGQAARAVADRARGFGLRLVAHDPFVEPDVFAASGVESMSLFELLESSEILSVHVPLTAETRHLLGRDELALLGDGAIVVNTARGAVIDQHALGEEVRSGRLAGVALDVLEEEPPRPDEPLLASDDVILTPHAGFLSVESLASVQRQAAEEVARVLSGGVPLHGVNIDRVSRLDRQSRSGARS